MATRSRGLIAQVAVIGVVAALAFPADGSAFLNGAAITLTATGPMPATLKMDAGTALSFVNQDSVTHMVSFANGLCSLTVSPGQTKPCSDDFTSYVGSYAYTVDGKFPGMVDTMPSYRSVTLTARTHKVRPGERLTLHGVARWDNTATPMASTAPFPVVVLAHYAGTPGYSALATVTMRGEVDTNDVWHLKVWPAVATTYIAELNGQLPNGRIWQNASSHPFTVRVRR